MAQLFPLAAITDEFSPDLAVSLACMQELGMTGAELRMVFGKNIIDLTDEELDRARQMVEAHGMTVIGIASPLLKCTLPDAPDVDPRFQQDMFAAKYGFADQPRLSARAFEIAGRLGARIIRVFSYWRTVDPHPCFDRIVAALRELADEALRQGKIIGLENEHACNIATGGETAAVLAALDHPALQVVWDPCNALISGEEAFPHGYGLIPIDRLAHVHAKDCHVDGHKPLWGPVGDGAVNWKGQIAALVRDGYHGFISLETHWPGPEGNKKLGSEICGRNLRDLVTA